MSNPLQNRSEDQRRPASEKIEAIYDLVGILLRTLLGIFGKRPSDGK